MVMPNSAISVRSPWLAVHKEKPDAKARLFCFPYAGGGAMTYHLWAEGLTDEIEVCPVQLPGRGNRLKEPAFRHVQPLVLAFAQVVQPYLDKPFAFFGHSMGAIIAFELAQHLAKECNLFPAHLFVSARRAPDLPVSNDPIYELPEPEFIDELRRLNGTPKELLEHRELMSLILPTIRADFAVCQTYEYTPKPPINCPLTVFGGLQDDEVPREQLEAWRKHTSADFTLRMVPSDHFYLHSSRPHLLEVISRQLQSDIKSPEVNRRAA